MRLSALLLILTILLFGLYFQHSNKIDYHIALAMPFTSNCSIKPDENMTVLIRELQQLGIPGGQISFAKLGQPVTSCAFGWGGSKGLLSEVSERDIFRYASLAKIFTSLTAINLDQQKKIDLDALLLPLLEQKILLSDPRIADIRLSHLLRHRAGFNRKISGDPMLNDFPWCPTNLSMLGNIRLDFTPDDDYSYSNLGYCLLGEALSRSTSKPLEKIISESLDFNQYKTFKRVPRLGGLDNEATYFFDSPDTKKQLLRFNYPAMLASGGWAGTATDLVMLLKQQLNTTDDKQYLADFGFDDRCDFSVWRNCHGLVFYKYQRPHHHLMYWRDGSLPGLSAFAATTQYGDSVVLLANYRKYQWLKFNDDIGEKIYRYLGN